MVMNSATVVRVARASAEAWQRAACIGERQRLRSEEMLDLICCFPLHQLSRLALCLCSFFCLPQPDSYFPFHDSSSSSSSSSSDDSLPYYYYYHSNSD